MVTGTPRGGAAMRRQSGLLVQPAQTGERCAGCGATVAPGERVQTVRADLAPGETQTYHLTCWLVVRSA